MKKLRFSTFAQVLTVLLCAAMIWVGLYVLDIRANVVWDLTPDLLTELSEGTIQTMDGLDESVHLHLVFKAETESDLRWMLETLAGSYVRTGHAVTDTIDPVTEPGKIRGYAESGKSISEGSVIVASADESRYVVVPVNDLYAYQMTSSGSYTITGLSAEQKITSAIRTVTGGERKQVWFLTGHDEAGMSACSYLVSRLQSDNYEVAETTLTQSDLQGGDILLILSPARDLTQEEKAALDAFLLEGGRLLMACDASLDLNTMPNFAAIAKNVSLSFESGIVVEDEQQTGWWMNSPLYLMPAINRDSDVLSSMQESQRVILPGARAISGPEIPLSGYSYETLLSTSEGAYVCPLDSDSIARTPDMPQGRQQLAVSVTHLEESTGKEMRMVLMGSLYTLVDNSLMNSTYNLDLTSKLIGYLAQRETETYIPVRTLNDDTLTAFTAQQSWRILSIVLTLPVLALVVGAVVLVRRRKK